ncbi:MAG: hypothetical protein SFZ24_03265 [Planctomycetota bacterium]|nr:hypothetical protein [Planctomycetota bacterium]
MNSRLSSLALAAALVPALLAPPACAPRNDASVPAVARADQSHGQGGPLAVTLTVQPTELTTAQRITLSIELTAAPGLTPRPIDLAAALPEEMTISEPGPAETRANADGSTTLIRQFLIEPFLPGSFQLGPIEFAADPAALPGAAPAEPVILRTQPVALTVRSVLEEGSAEFAPEKDVVDPPPVPIYLQWWAWLGTGAIGAALLAAAMIIRRRREALRRPLLIPAHRIALWRLASIGAASAPPFHPGALHEAASLILRRYIEDRFGIHAPERTTEEFLAEAAASPALAAEELTLLAYFLRACDLVKFAGVIPDAADAGQLVSTLRAFIERTASDTALVKVARRAPEAEAA